MLHGDGGGGYMESNRRCYTASRTATYGQGWGAISMVVVVVVVVVCYMVSRVGVGGDWCYMGVVVVVVVVLLHGRWSPATSWVLQEPQPAWTEVHWAVLHIQQCPGQQVGGGGGGGGFVTWVDLI